jgi:hypothetical protein
MTVLPEEVATFLREMKILFPAGALVKKKRGKARGVLFLPQSSARTKCAGNFIVDAAVVFSVSQSYGIFNFTSHR